MRLTREDKVKIIANNFFLFFKKEAMCSKCDERIFKDNHEIKIKLNKIDFDFIFKCNNCHFRYILWLKYKALNEMLEFIKYIDFKKTHECLIL